MFLCSNFSPHTQVYQPKTFQAEMKEELVKPGKGGPKKTPKECVDSFSKVLQDGGIANNTFMRNAGVAASSSNSKSMPLHLQALEDQLEAERATAAALRVENHRLSLKLEASETHLEHYRENHEKVVKMLHTWI